MSSTGSDFAPDRADEPSPAHSSDLPLVAEEPSADVQRLTVTYVRAAGMPVTLNHPFRLGDRLIEQMVLPPVPLGVALDVQTGTHKTLLDVMIATTGEPLELFRALRGGDEELVIGTFLKMLPASVRDLIEGR